MKTCIKIFSSNGFLAKVSLRMLGFSLLHYFGEIKILQGRNMPTRV
jgi:hypothetical protein